MGVVYVSQKTAHRAYHGVLRGNVLTDAVGKLRFDQLAAVFIFKPVGMIVRHRGFHARGDKLLKLRLGKKRDIHDDLAGRIGSQLVGELLYHIRAVKSSGGNRARGHVSKANAALEFSYVNGAKIVIVTLAQHTGFKQRTRGNHAYNVAAHKSLGGCRILHLLADSYLKAFCNKLCYIGVCRVERNSAHRRALGLTAVLPRQGQVDCRRRRLCVVVEHLVKVSNAVKKQEVLILIFYLEILLHHRSHGVLPRLLDLENYFLEAQSEWQVLQS